MTRKMNWASGLFVLMVVGLVQGEPQYEVQVQLPFKFSYKPISKVNQLADGSCCSLNETAPDCTTQCSQIQITLCFRENHHSLNDNDITNCSLGMITASHNSDSRKLVILNATSDTVTTTFPGSYHVVYEIKALEGIIDQEVNIQNQSMSIRTILSGERTSVVIVGLGVVCREGYFGPDCGCTPRDDSTGHFTCDVNGTIVCLPGYQNTANNCVEEITTPETIIKPEIINTTPDILTTESLSIALIAGGGAGSGVLIIIIIVAVCVYKCKNKRHSARNTITIASRSEEKTNTSNDSVQHSEENETQQKEAHTITLNQDDIYSEVKKKKAKQEHTDKEPHYTNVTTPQYSVPTNVPKAQYSTSVSTKELHYSTPVSRDSTLTSTVQYNTPVSTLPRPRPEETQYNTPVTSPGTKETTLSPKKPQVVYADLKVSTLPRAEAEQTQTVKVDKTEAVQYSEIQL